MDHAHVLWTLRGPINLFVMLAQIGLGLRDCVWVRF